MSSERVPRLFEERSRGSLVVVANRLPVRRNPGSPHWERSAGGLVSALDPILSDRGGAWVGWEGSASDRDVRLDRNGYRIHGVPLSAEDVEAYYDGFANAAIWPLYHGGLRESSFRPEWWRRYVLVNRRFAERVSRIADGSDTVWVHDYHLQLLPAMLREAGLRGGIGFFLHIPFPPQEIFDRMPWRREIVEGLLGANLIGFQTRRSADNFRDAARRLGVASPSARDTLRIGDRRVQLGVHPISVPARRFAQLADSPSVDARAREIRKEMGDRRILLGVDRLDYSKGIDARLDAYEQLLDTGSLDPRTSVLAQVAVPSRERVDAYARVREAVEERVERINARHGRPGRSAVHHLHTNLGVEELVAWYRAASTLIVTSLADGMNLVAKEWVATRTRHDGALVLSEFTGAAGELDRALLANPYHVDGLARVIARALAMSPAEQRRRMARMHRHVMSHDVEAWGAGFLVDLERATRMPRLAARGAAARVSDGVPAEESRAG